MVGAERSLAARMFDAHARLRTIATTGTNGKTTTTSMIAAIVAAAGEPEARVTTVGAWAAGRRVPASTPQAEFVSAVERAVEAGVRTLALEVTSRALASGVAKRLPPHVAVFTNLTRDHLDVHESAEHYLASKAQLFVALPHTGVAVLNADDPASTLLREVIAPGVEIITYSVRDASATLAATRVDVRAGDTRITLAPSPLANALEGSLALAVTGGVHAQNALAAALAADAAGYPASAIRAGLAGFTGVAGRFELVAREPLVVVDYAHTPDGLAGTLVTARELCTNGRVICVFGCGGERDRGKRSQMGAVADANADVVIVTNDNPRRESPVAIADDIRSGVPNPRAEWSVELDRARAIAHAVAGARAEDVVIIAGKGHEQIQELGNHDVVFSDVDVARAAYACRP
jgi:UDP-N-acetylmuramoyl-L-alanyl-D-glutamate--2,6-diaminopimelate ligase